MSHIGSTQIGKFLIKVLDFALWCRVYIENKKGGEPDEMAISSCHPLLGMWGNRWVPSMTLNCSSVKARVYRPWLFHFSSHLRGLSLCHKEDYNLIIKIDREKQNVPR